jgi:hypothetical protein
MRAIGSAALSRLLSSLHFPLRPPSPLCRRDSLRAAADMERSGSSVQACHVLAVAGSPKMLRRLLLLRPQFRPPCLLSGGDLPSG